MFQFLSFPPEARLVRLASRAKRAKGGNFQEKGFTIIELLIAMALFLTLVGIASGGFVKALRTQRAIVSLMAINDNASLALEQMAREIRTGYNFNKISENELRFINANGINTCYRLNNQSLERGVNCDASGADYKKINADNVKITKFNIVLFGQENDDGYPPLITISLSVGTTNKYLGNILTNIQTTISSRIIGEIF